MPTPGFDTFIVDDPTAGIDATATDTLYLLSAAGPATPTIKKKADTGDATLDAQLRAYFALGGRSVVVQGVGTGSPLPTLANALALLPQGPGQIVVPESLTSGPLVTIAEAAWAQNKVALLQGASTLTDSQLVTLAAAITAGATTGARGAALFADYALVPQVDGSGTDLIPWTIVVAALIAKNDRLLGNPNVAAAGVQGVASPDVVLGVHDLRNETRIQTLKNAQVNSAKLVGTSLRTYGFRTLADLDVIPHWWDLSGSRTVMAFRALAAAIDEEFVFSPIDGHGHLLERYKGRLQTAAKSLYDVDALYGDSPDEAYRVDTSEAINPQDAIAAGEVTAQVYLKTSPYTEHLVTNITRRAITAAV